MLAFQQHVLRASTGLPVENQEVRRAVLAQERTTVAHATTMCGRGDELWDTTSLQQRDNPTISNVAHENPSRCPSRHTVVSKERRDSGVVVEDKSSTGERAPTYDTDMAVTRPSFDTPAANCPTWCSCTCHRRTSLVTPRSIDSLVGFVAVGVSGSTILRRKCSERKCRRAPTTTLTFAYFFPSWYRLQAFQALLAFSASKGVTWSLRPQTIVDGESDIFNFAVQGNIEGIRRLFVERRASPFDVSASNGRTALSV